MLYCSELPLFFFTKFFGAPDYIHLFSVGDNTGGVAGANVDTVEMELWDTVTNEITPVNHPPGFETKKFFRPMISTFGEDSILFTGGSINNEEDHDGEVFQYTCGTGWESKDMLDPVLESRQMYGIYSIKDDTPLKQKEILNVCKDARPSK